MDATTSTRRRRTAVTARCVGFVLLAASALLLTSTGSARAASSSTAGSAWLRAAHLSPDTGPVDVWLTPFGGTASGPATLSHVSYGTVSAYRSLPPGFYAVSMRPAGAAVGSPALLTGQVQIVAGRAYSVFAEGAGTALSLHVVADDLTLPGPDRARVRLIQASTVEPAVDVSAVQGPMLAQGAAYGAVSAYAEVPQGRWTLHIAPTDGAGVSTSAPVDVSAGTVVSLFILNGSSGSVRLEPVVDAAAAGSVPVGGVNTGAGGLAGSGRRTRAVLGHRRGGARGRDARRADDPGGAAQGVRGCRGLRARQGHSSRWAAVKPCGVASSRGRGWSPSSWRSRCSSSGRAMTTAAPRSSIERRRAAR